MILVHLVSRIVAWLVLEVAARASRTPRSRHPGSHGGRSAPLVGLEVVRTHRPTRVSRAPSLDPQTGRFTYSAWAFYPLFPLLMRGLDAIGVPFIAGALVLNVVLSTLAAVLIWATLARARTPTPAPACSTRPRRRVSVVLLPGNARHAQTLHRGLGDGPHRCVLVGPAAAALPTRRPALGAARFHPGRGSGPRTGRPGPPGGEVARDRRAGLDPFGEHVWRRSSCWS